MSKNQKIPWYLKSNGQLRKEHPGIIAIILLIPIIVQLWIARNIATCNTRYGCAESPIHEIFLSIPLIIALVLLIGSAYYGLRSFREKHF